MSSNKKWVWPVIDKGDLYDCDFTRDTIDSLINALSLEKTFNETDEEKVARILKRDFETAHGMTFDKFIEVYQRMLKECPEKLI